MQLKKSIGLWSAISIVIGSVIGSGIFMKPATMAGQLGSPVLLIVVWILAGIISFFGGMVYSELGSMYPDTGGSYVYIQKMYGDFVAFLYGWSTIAVINTAAVAAIAFVCADYCGYFFHFPHFSVATEQSIRLHIPMVGNIFPLQNFAVKLLAILIIIGLTIVNYISVQSANAINFLTTAVKIIAFVVLILGILLFGHGDAKNLIKSSPHFNLGGWSLLGAFMAAMTGAFACYDGWININMVAGEIENPKKNLTKSLLIGIGTCVIVYVLINCAYMYMLPIDTMASSTLVASDATSKALGFGGGGIIAILIIITVFGATNINLLTSARIVFAMGGDKTFFSWAAKVHPKFQTPGNSVILIGVWSSLFVVSGSFDLLADMFIFMSWVFYGLTVVGIFILRKKHPDVERPYKVKAYPIVPLIFTIFTFSYTIVTLYTDIDHYRNGKSPVINSILGLLLTLAGIPLYWYLRKKNPATKISV